MIDKARPNLRIKSNISSEKMTKCKTYMSILVIMVMGIDLNEVSDSENPYLLRHVVLKLRGPKGKDLSLDFKTVGGAPSEDLRLKTGSYGVSYVGWGQSQVCFKSVQ